MKKIIVSVLLCLLAVGAAPFAWAQAPQTYLALGDSYAFGYTTLLTTPPSFGDQGYVRPYADWLATQNGGVRPDVINLGVPGETTTSFFTGGESGRLLNRNYAPSFNTSQADLLRARIAQETAAGRVIGPITVQLGGNDILGLIASPGFQNADEAMRGQMLARAYETLQANYTSLLTLLRAEAPRSEIFLLGYFDPLAGLGAQNPLAGLSTPLTLATNALIAAQASAFGAQYVDLYMPFLGRETELTYITTQELGFPNYHPNAQGYNVIAQQLIQASAIPEPGTCALLAGGLVLLTGSARRRRSL